MLIRVVLGDAVAVGPDEAMAGSVERPGEGGQRQEEAMVGRGGPFNIRGHRLPARVSFHPVPLGSRYEKKPRAPVNT